MENCAVKMLISVFIFISVIPYQSAQESESSPWIPEDSKLNFTSLGRKYGQIVEEHDVTTEDGYILKLFHIPGNKSRTVLLMHGVLDSADTFIIRGRESMAITLATSGYDVWAGNVRGCRYSRRHINLNPDLDKLFWDYSYHEMGYYDLPSIIDYILTKNSIQQLNAMGHSQGNSIFYVLGSTRPEYNDKIKVLVALGPVCYFDHLKKPVTELVGSGPFINEILLAFNQDEVLGDSSIYRLLINMLCRQKVMGYTICGQGVFFSLAGKDVEEFESDFFYIVIGHFPTSTSRKNALHLMQNANTNNFTQFDYGLEKNLQLYKSMTPPKYDLSKVTMRIALLAGKNDKLTPLKDVYRLGRELPNVEDVYIMKRAKFNHIDHVWGRHMKKYLFPRVLEILGKYN